MSFLFLIYRYFEIKDSLFGIKKMSCFCINQIVYFTELATPKRSNLKLKKILKNEKLKSTATTSGLGVYLGVRKVKLNRSNCVRKLKGVKEECIYVGLSLNIFKIISINEENTLRCPIKSLSGRIIFGVK